MEHVREILKQTGINTSRANTGTWSSAEEAPSPGSNCPVCKGAGIVHPLLPTGKPDFSRVVPCRCVRKELDSERRERLQRYSHLGSLSHLTFDNLLREGRSGNPAHQKRFAAAYDAAKAFAAEPKGWFVLGGPSGSGKTHLAVAIANEALKHGYPVLYQTVPDLLHHLRSAFNPESETAYDEFFEQVRNVRLLVLDDLGVQSNTSWAKEKLDQILTYRFNSELPTVIVIIGSIEGLDERLRTRLTDSRLCRVFTFEEESTSPSYGWGPEFELQKNMTFANFDWKRVNLPPEERENLAEAFKLAVNFAKAPEGWLVFMGVTGCGKTHLAAAIVNYCYQAGQSAMFVVVAEFLDHLRSTFSPESKVSYDELFESVKTAPLLVLDDFGEQSTTPWAREKLYQVINYRYNACLPTVITTRLSLDEIMAKFEESVSSRLNDAKFSTPFNIIVPDYRGSRGSEKRRRDRKLR